MAIFSKPAINTVAWQVLRSGVERCLVVDYAEDKYGTPISALIRIPGAMHLWAPKVHAVPVEDVFAERDDARVDFKRRGVR